MPSKAVPATLKRRWTEERMHGKLPKEKKKVKRQRHYHSSDDDSENEGAARDAPIDDTPRDLRPKDLEGSNAQKLGVKPAKKEKAKSNKKEVTEESAPPAKPAPKFSKTIAAPKPILKAPKPDPKADLSSTDESEDDEDDMEVDEYELDSEADSSDAADDDEEEEEEEEDAGSDISETSTNAARKVRKRNDPDAFATSMSKILGTKLTTSKRSEPILARSKAAQDANKTLADHKLTVKARRELIAEKKAALEKGHVKDVMGLAKTDVSTADIVAHEKTLKRTAQKGVIKLFNAVRAAQVKAEQAEKEAKAQGVVGIAKREEQVKEMSKQGFLDMITGGAKKKEGSVEA